MPQINQLYRQAYGRNPGFEEWRYWASRIQAQEKRNLDELLGAMQWQAAKQR